MKQGSVYDGMEVDFRWNGTSWNCNQDVVEVNSDYTIMADGRTYYDNLEVPTDAILHYSFDEVPDLPDGSYVYKHNNDFTSTSEWLGNGLAILDEGKIHLVNTTTQYKYVNTNIPANSIIIIKGTGVLAGRFQFTVKYSGDSSDTVLSDVTIQKDTPFEIIVVTENKIAINFSFFAPSGNSCNILIEQMYVGDGSYNTPIIDNSYGGHNATNNNTLATKGVCGKGVKLPNINADGIVISDVYNKLNSDFTFSVWVNPENESENVNDNIIASYEQFILRNGSSWSSTLMMYIYTNDNGTVQENLFYLTNLLDANKWSHIIVTKSGTTVKLYINSELRYTGTCESNILNHNSNSLVLPTEQRIKSLDDFQIFDRALSELEVKALYQNKANTPKFVTSMYNNEENWNDLTIGISYRKSFGTVHLNIYSAETFTAIGEEYTEIGTLPEGYRPKTNIDIPLSFLGGSNYGFVRVLTSGVISVYVNTTTSYFSTCGSF